MGCGKTSLAFGAVDLSCCFCLEYFFVGCPLVKNIDEKNRQTLDETLDVYSTIPTFHSIVYGNFRVILWRITYGRILAVKFGLLGFITFLLTGV